MSGSDIGRLSTKDDVSEPKSEIQALGDEIRAEMRRLTRELIVGLSITIAALNGLVFLALELD